jgi:hypothetical protein
LGITMPAPLSPEKMALQVVEFGTAESSWTV